MDEWKKLWNFWDAGKVDPYALTTCFPDFIKKIRIEGDKLQSRLESAREYFEIHCMGCDVEDDDCEGCSYDYIKFLLGFQSSATTANEVKE